VCNCVYISRQAANKPTRPIELIVQIYSDSQHYITENFRFGLVHFQYFYNITYVFFYLSRYKTTNVLYAVVNEPYHPYDWFRNAIFIFQYVLTGRIFLEELTEHDNPHVRMSIHIKCLF